MSEQHAPLPIEPDDDEDPSILAPQDGEEVVDPDEGEVAVEGPEHRRITVRKDLRKRVDVYLGGRLVGISRNRIQQLIELGGVKINDRLVKSSTKIRANDVIDIILPPRAVRRILPENIPLDVLYEDEHFIVVNKQANLIVHPARSHLSGTLLNGLAYRFKQQVESAGQRYKHHQTRGFESGLDLSEDGSIEGLSAVGAQEFRPGIIHRLDKNTTGVMVVAKSDAAHWGIARQFEDRTTLKAYLAIIHGNFDSVGGAIDFPLGKHPTIREACAVRHDSVAKHALTLFRVREQYKGYSLVELELKTGRTHQIRVHLSYVGHPIVGDIIYGGEAIGRHELDEPPIAGGSRKNITFARDKEQGQKLEAQAAARPDLIIAHPALHASLLRFIHPITKVEMTFTAPLHEPMRGLVGELRKRREDMPVATEGYWVDMGKTAP